MNLSTKDLIAFIELQKKIFDIVRIVDVSMTTQYIISDNGKVEEQPYQCYAVWNKNKRCENCISAKAFALKSKLTKFEFVENEVYFVMSIYTEIENKEYTLEMVSKLNDETLFGACGKDKFIETIENYNRKLYVDALTGAYNRHYYEEQLRKLNHMNSFVMIDVDNFKYINDTYGHSTGDFVLKEVVKVILPYIESSDAVIRMGGDEFLLVFQDISKNTLSEKLENIRQDVLRIISDKYSELKVSISMGAVYSSKLDAGLVDLADKALYEAKKRKNSIIIKESYNK